MEQVRYKAEVRSQRNCKMVGVLLQWFGLDVKTVSVLVKNRSAGIWRFAFADDLEPEPLPVGEEARELCLLVADGCGVPADFSPTSAVADANGLAVQPQE